MRDRERLIEVLRSVNRNAVGHGRTYSLIIADALSETDQAVPDIAFVSANAMGLCPSPHIRELAAEALHYLGQDARAALGGKHE